MLSGLRESGCEVTFLSSALSSEYPWEESSILNLKKNSGANVEIYQGSVLDYEIKTFVRRIYKFLKRNPSLNSIIHTPPGMQRWFAEMIHKHSPDIVLMSYAFWDGLINHPKLKSIRVIDAIDLLSLNERMRQALQKHLPAPPIHPDKIDMQVLKENFFDQFNFSPESKEFHIYDKYDYTIAISPKEADWIKQNTRKTKVLLIPMTQKPSYIQNQYTGPAIFPTGPNPFNIQGYLYFVKRVLPLVRKKDSTFLLQVTGTCCQYVCPAEGILFNEFIPDLGAVYEKSKFLICPVFGGTGQQVKILEAMAHGVPVIALRAAAEGTPIQHGVSGLIANNADEFADYVIQLWNDKAMCRRLGEAGRNKVAMEFARPRLLEGLSSILEAC